MTNTASRLATAIAALAIAATASTGAIAGQATDRLIDRLTGVTYEQPAAQTASSGETSGSAVDHSNDYNFPHDHR